jgi:AcrR family transcriptional regulator
VLIVSPRRSVLEARQTRADILATGVRLASTEGLEGLTIGRLATALDMSKSGVLGHFGSKEDLQLAVVNAAADIFVREVADRARGVAPGLPKLLALCAAWVSYLERRVFPGGCFFTAAAAEFDDRPGRVRDEIVGLTSVWDRDLYRQTRLAVQAGELPADTDADQVVFEMSGVILALNNALQLHRDTTAPGRARRALGRLLGYPIAVTTLLLAMASHKIAWSRVEARSRGRGRPRLRGRRLRAGGERA